MTSSLDSPPNDAPRPDPSHADGPDDQPWIETRAGGLFFVNALLVAPVGIVLVPVLFGALVRWLGWVQGPSAMLDTIPAVAWYFAPRVGWLAAPAAWLAWKGRGVTERRWPRIWLTVFTGLHLAVLAFTVWRWFGGGESPFPLP